jgi:drug/metabolite transporter (DMT)-like permease
MWIVLSLFAGLGDALRDATTKKFSLTLPNILIASAYSTFALPFLLPLLLFSIPEQIPKNFWYLSAATSSLHVVGGLILVRALQLGELSLSTPLTAFTPVFLIITAPLITGESLSRWGIAGSCMVVVGSYVLNLSKKGVGFFAPLKALLYTPAARLMLLLSFIWSITGSIDRVAVQHFPLHFWAPAQMLLTSLIYLPLVIYQKQFSGFKNPTTIKGLMLIGGFNALSFLTYLYALALAPVYYVICVKRSSIIFSIFLGKKLFDEENIGEKLLGAICMILGVAIISLLG